MLLLRDDIFWLSWHQIIIEDLKLFDPETVDKAMWDDQLNKIDKSMRIDS